MPFRRLVTALLTAAVLAVAPAGCGSTAARNPAGAGAPVPTTAAPTTAPPVTTPAPATTAPAPRPGTPPHVMVVVMENREDSDVLGSPDAPYLNGLARRYGVATASYGRTHPSLPNYLDLISGSTHGITSDCTGCSVDGTTLVDQLAAAGIPWRAYMEALPHPCYTSASASGGYARKHDPFVYFRHLVADPALCGQVVPAGRLTADLASAAPPDFVWLTPNLCDDGHDCSTATADRWMRRTLGPVLASPWFAAGGILVVTYDEGGSDASCCGVAAGGRIATVVVTDRVPGGRRWSRPVDHAGILGTIEDLYGLPRLGEAARPASGSLLYLTGS